MILNAMLAAALAAAGISAQTAETAPAIAPASVATAKPTILLPKGTMVRLMVMNEVNSRDHQAGHRFVLRVDEEVKANGVTLVPIGAKAWGEVVSAAGTGGAGKGGRLNARLLYLDADGKQIPLDGERRAAGNSSTGQVVTGVVAFGIFGLLMKGNNAKLKAGEILNGYTLEDARFDLPVTAP
jgi:hypothetical protein